MPGPKLIVGLGNPGKEYAATRHNVGAWWLEELWQQSNIQTKVKSEFHAQYAAIMYNDCKIHTIKPSTYMNESGIAVQAVSKFYKIAPDEILIVHDELDLNPGTCRLKYAGGHAGHNGLRNITQHIGNNFHRLRLGIGHPGVRDQVSSYVLSKPDKIDAEKIHDVIAISLNLLPKIVAGEWEKVAQAL